MGCHSRILVVELFEIFLATVVDLLAVDFFRVSLFLHDDFLLLFLLLAIINFLFWLFRFKVREFQQSLDHQAGCLDILPVVVNIVHVLDQFKIFLEVPLSQ